MKNTTYGLIGIMLMVWVSGCGGDENGQNGSGDSTMAIDTTKPLITPAEIAAQEKIKLIPYREDSLWGFADTTGAVIIPAQYQAVEPFHEGLAVVKRGTHYGMIDKKGREIVPTDFLEILPSSCGVLTLRQKEGYILLGINGKRLTQDIYEKVFVDGCNQGRIPVVLNGKAAFLDIDGKNITGYQFEDLFPFHHGLAPAKRKGKWGMIGMDGKDRVSFQFEALYPMVGGQSVGMERDVSGLERWGVIDSTGKTIVPFQFGRITGSFQGSHVAAAARNPMDLFKAGIPPSKNTWFIFNRQGILTGETHAQPWDDFADGLVVAEMEGKFGFIDTTGQVVIPYKYDWACGFRNGMAWVGKDGLYGFINRQGQTVIPFKYHPVFEYVYMEEDGALVSDPKTGERFYVNKQGKEFRKP